MSVCLSVVRVRVCVRALRCVALRGAAWRVARGESGVMHWYSASGCDRGAMVAMPSEESTRGPSADRAGGRARVGQAEQVCHKSKRDSFAECAMASGKWKSGLRLRVGRVERARSAGGPRKRMAKWREW